MLFHWKRSTLPKVKLKKPTVFHLPVFSGHSGGILTQLESFEQAFVRFQEHLLASQMDKQYCFLLSDWPWLQAYLNLFPEDRSLLSQLVQAGRCGLAGMYQSPDEALIGGEAFLRNLLHGQIIEKTFFHSESSVQIHLNPISHITQLPQILNQCGIHGIAVHPEMIRNMQMPPFFNWYAPEGSTLIALVYDLAAPEDPIEEQGAQSLQKLREQHTDVEAILLIETLALRPPRAANIGQWQKQEQAEPSLVLSGSATEKSLSYLNTLAVHKKFHLLPFMNGNTHPRVCSALTRMDMKIANRLCENRIFEAELWGTIASILGMGHPESTLGEAWQNVMAAQYQEVFSGSGTDILFLDHLEGLRNALELATQERNLHFKRIASQVNTESVDEANSIIVFQSLPWKGNDLARIWLSMEEGQFPITLYDQSGEEVPYEIETVVNDAQGHAVRAHIAIAQTDLPGVGFAQIKKVPSTAIPLPYVKKGQSRNWLENEFFRIEVHPDKGGGIVSLYEKETGKEFIRKDSRHPGNDLVLFAEEPGEDPAGRLYTKKERIYGSDSKADVEYLEGPVSSRLHIRAHGPGPCARIQEITLYHELLYIDCVTILEDYQGDGFTSFEGDRKQLRALYAILFPLDLAGALPVVEDRFYAKAVRRNAGVLDFHAETGKSIMTPAYRWVDISWTLLLRFMSGDEETSSLAIGPAEVVIGSEIYRDLRLDVMRYLARHGVASIPRQGGDPAQNGRACAFAIGKREENQYTQHLLDRHSEAREYYERSLKEIGFVFLAVPDPEEKIPAFIFAGNNEKMAKQAVEEMIQSTVAHRWQCPASTCFLPDKGRVDDTGFAVLNRGTSLCSLEADGTLALALMHTAPYKQPQTSWPFDFAERKTHLFQYRLIPHAGDWRNAEIPRRAMEYNHPPVAVEETSHGGLLPSQHAFLSLEPSNLLISALKPSGFPAAEFKKPVHPQTSCILRFHEMHGEETNIWLETSLNVRSVRLVQINEQPLPRKKGVLQEGSVIRSVAHAHEILNYKLNLRSQTPIRVQGVDEKTAPRIVSCHAWRSNRSGTPGGYIPLALSLHGDVNLESPLSPGSILPLELVAVNHSIENSFNGHILLTAPPYWRILPERLNCQLSPGAHQTLPFHLILDGPHREGYVKAQVAYGSSLIEDLLHIGPLPEFDLEMRLTKEAFHVILRQDKPYTLTGTISLISPVESWPNDAAEDFSLSSYRPRDQQFVAAPGESCTVSFPVSEPQNRFSTPVDHFWMVVKMEVHHTLRYYHVRLDGQESLGLGRILLPS